MSAARTWIALGFLTTASAAELEVLDETLRCDLRSPCTIRVRARGGHIQKVHAKAVDVSQSKAFESNEVFAPSEQTSAITLTLRREALPADGKEIPIDIHFIANGTAGTPKKARLTVQSAAPGLLVFDGKPVSILARRKLSQSASGNESVVVRSTEPLGKCPEAIATELYRTVGEERYVLTSGSSDIMVGGTTPRCNLSIRLNLPPGNYTAAGGTIYLRAQGLSQETAVPLLIRIKDHWGWPLVVLIVGHTVMWGLRLWSGQLRPRALNHRVLLRLAEEVRTFEFEAGESTSEKRETARQLKVKIARARRLNEEGDAVEAAKLLAEAQSIIDNLTGGGPPGAVARTAPRGAVTSSNIVVRSFKSVSSLVVQWDLPVEFVAMGISILLGAGIFVNADRFGTYEDYLKVFLFGFGISTSAQGFAAVLGQFKRPSDSAV